MTDTTTPGPVERIGSWLSFVGQSKAGREGMAFALYVSLSLRSVAFAVPSSAIDTDDRVTLVRILLFAVLGLVGAHYLASSISTRLAIDGSEREDRRATLVAMLMAATMVSAVVLLPIVVFGTGALPTSKALLSGLAACVAYRAGRNSGHSRRRAAAYAFGILVLIGGIVLLENGGVQTSG